MSTASDSTVDRLCHHDWQLELHNHEKQEWTLWVHGAFDDVISDYVAFREGTLGERYDKARLVGPYRCYSTTCPGCSRKDPVK